MAATARPSKSCSDVVGNADGPVLVYNSVEDWYRELLAPMVQRRMDAAGSGTLTFCPRWWAHPEAVSRLEALWRAWEVCADTGGEAPSRWFSQHCDPALAVLLDAKLGPLADCRPDQHRKYANTAHLPVVPAPPGHWGTTTAAG